MYRLQKIRDKVDRYLGEPDEQNRWEDMWYLLNKIDELEEKYSDYEDMWSELEFLKDELREYGNLADEIEEKAEELVSTIRRKGY